MQTIQQYYSESYEGSSSLGKGDKEFSLKFPEDVSVFKLKPDVTNVIDIIPFRIVGDKHPLVHARKIQGDGSEYDDIFMYYEHSYMNDNGDSVLCLNKMYGEPCPICEERKRIAEISPDGWKDERVKALKPKAKVAMNVIDWKERSKGIQIWTGSAFRDRNGLLDGSKLNREDQYDTNVQLSKEGDTFKIAVRDWRTKQVVETEHIYFQSPTNGFGVAIPAKNDTFDGHEFVKPVSFSLKPRDQQYKRDIVDKAYNIPEFLNIKTYDEIASLFFAIDRPDMDDDGDYSPSAPALDVMPTKPQETVTEEAPIKPVSAVAEPEVAPELSGKLCSYGKKFGLDYETCPECDDCLENNVAQYSKCAKASQTLAKL